MDVVTNLIGGFATCLSPYNISMAALGAFLGTMVGILPGLGPSATMAIILPITFGMDATPAMIMLNERVDIPYETRSLDSGSLKDMEQRMMAALGN